MILTRELANRVYDVLVAGVGAPEREREQFVRLHSTEDISEWRFCGYLGFGGKFWSSTMTVTFYNEDSTPVRRTMQAATNAALATLRSDT